MHRHERYWICDGRYFTLILIRSLIEIVRVRVRDAMAKKMVGEKRMIMIMRMRMGMGMRNLWAADDELVLL